MAEFAVCQQSELGDKLFLCEDVKIPEGALYAVYFGSGGIYAIAAQTKAPGRLYIALRELFRTSRVMLYVLSSGEYEHSTESFTRILNDDELTEAVNRWIQSDWDFLTEDTLRQNVKRLTDLDSRTRGMISAEDGTVFLQRGNRMVTASPCPPGLIYTLTLFGGVFGLHRFALGKWFSALVYLFTGGFFGVGWLMDIVSLLFGIEKDSQKRYVMALENKFLCLLILPLGIITGKFFISLYFKFFGLIATALTMQATQLAQSISPQTVVNFMTNLQNLITRFE